METRKPYTKISRKSWQRIRCGAVFVNPVALYFRCGKERGGTDGAFKFSGSGKAFWGGESALCGAGALKMLIGACQFQSIAVAGASGILHSAAGAVFV